MRRPDSNTQVASGRSRTPVRGLQPGDLEDRGDHQGEHEQEGGPADQPQRAANQRARRRHRVANDGAKRARRETPHQPCREPGDEKSREERQRDRLPLDRRVEGATPER